MFAPRLNLFSGTIIHSLVILPIFRFHMSAGKRFRGGGGEGCGEGGDGVELGEGSGRRGKRDGV